MDQHTWLGLIPGFKITITFLYYVWAFFLFQKLRTDSVIYADSRDINIWSDSLKIRFLIFSQNFEISWVPVLCVGLFLPKSPFWSRNFNPHFSDFWLVFHLKPYLHHHSPRRHLYQKMQNFLTHIFIYKWKVCRILIPPPPPLAQRPRKNWKVHFQRSAPRK